jgi:hypothetical protein
VTATVPIDPHVPGHDQARTRVRKAARAAIAALPKVGLQREVAERLASRLEDLPDEVERQVGYASIAQGLACYVTPDVTRIVSVHHAPPERVMVADAFSLAVPITDVARRVDVDVLVLSTGGGATSGARLYHLDDAGITERVEDGLPMSYDPRDADPRHADEGTPDAAKRDARLTDFLNVLDEALTAVLGNGDGAPLVIVGVERLRRHFADVRSAALTRRVLTEVDRNVDRATDAELAAIVRDAVIAARRDEALAAIAELRELPPVRTATGPDDIHAMAAEGRVHHLLVEEGATDQVEQDGVILGDRIARTIRACFDSGARITVVPAGSLGNGGIAAIARW